MSQFSYLTQNGLDVMTAISISFSDSENILYHLKQGKRLSQLIYSGHSKFFQSISILSDVLNLQECIDCIHSMEQGQSGLKTTLLKQMIYPFFLIGFSYFLILFFTWSILPVMEAYVSASLMQSVRMIFVGYSILIWVVLVVAILLLFGHHFPTLDRYLSSLSFQRQVTTYTFCTMYRNLHQKGCTSMECIRVIERMESKRVKKVAQIMMGHLEQGISFLDSIQKIEFLDPTFVRFVKIGAHSSQMDKILSAYEQTTLEQLRHKVKRASGYFQIFSYAMVAVLLFVFYQVMLVPMNILDSF